MMKFFFAAGFCTIICFGATAQEFKLGLNVFPFTAYKLGYDKEFLILPDNSSLKGNEDWQINIRKIHLCGLFLRYNNRRFFAKTEFNYFNRYLKLGRNITVPYQSTERGYLLALSHLTFEVPLYLGYTLNYNHPFKITPFVGISCEIGKMKPLVPVFMKTIFDSDEEWRYKDYFDQNKTMSPVLVNYAAGVEFMYYGTLLQIAVKKNVSPLTDHTGGNANITDLMMVEGTLGFVFNRGGATHKMIRGR